MRLFSCILLLMALFISCQNIDRMEKPKDLISEDKMVEILTEVTLLHAARNYNKSMLEETGIDPEAYIWEKYDIDSLQFAQSSSYYAENYRQYEAIYAEVKAKLEGYRAIYDSLQQAQGEVQDSLRVLRKEPRELEPLRKAPESQ